MARLLSRSPEALAPDPVALDAGATTLTLEGPDAAAVAAAPPAVAFEDVTKRYGAVRALDGLSLAIERGEILGLLGPNGSGKTTTVNLLCGLLSPTSGTISVFGHDVTREPALVRPLLGVVPQETALYGQLSAQRNLRFHAELYGVPRGERDERVRAMLELVDLWERRTSAVKTFSGGMKRQLAIARAMLHRPAILYLDEPTLGVDVASRRAIWSYIRELRERGTSVLLTTNYLDEASELCDRIVIIDRGRSVAAGTPVELRHSFGDSVLTLTLVREPSASLLASLRDVRGVVSLEGSGAELRVTYTEGDAAAGAVLNAVGGLGLLRSVAQRDASLDEVFLRLTTAGDEE